jgi:hypothetical protein
MGTGSDQKSSGITKLNWDCFVKYPPGNIIVEWEYSYHSMVFKADWWYK